MSAIDLTGKRFGKLVVVERFYPFKKDGYAKWLCRCDCGGTSTPNGANLRSGISKSCGCEKINALKKRSIKHGMTNTPEFKAWVHMIDRCNNPANGSYKDYGGRGISVCDRWVESFDNFFNDMGHRPSSKHSIDRQNVNGNYEPSNCRWATKLEQARNKRNNRRLNYNGKMMTVSEVCEVANITRMTLYNKLNSGKPIGKDSTSKIVLNQQTGIFYDSIVKAAESYNIQPHTLMKRLNGHVKNKTPFIKV